MGRKQNYPVQLTAEERETLRTITRTGKHSARVIQRAQVLLRTMRASKIRKSSKCCKLRP